MAFGEHELLHSGDIQAESVMESLARSGRRFLCPTRVAPLGNARTYYCRKLPGGGGMVFLISRDKVGSNHQRVLNL